MKVRGEKEEKENKEEVKAKGCKEVMNLPLKLYLDFNCYRFGTYGLHMEGFAKEEGFG